MKKRKIDASVERQIVTGMVVSTPFLRRLKAIYRQDLMEAGFAKIVGEWCLSYFDNYDKAPGRDIEDVYNSHVREGMDEDLAELISTFLASLSAEYEHSEKFNVQYALDQAEKKFKSVSLKNLAEDVKAYLSQNEILEAEARVTGYKQVAQSLDESPNPFLDDELIHDVFSTDEDGASRRRLFSYPGALGKVLNDQLVREGFIGIMAPEKRGKSFLNVEFAMKAALARCNVAFFEVGDMSRGDVLRRCCIYLTEKSDRKRYCGKLKVPVLDCERNQDNTCGFKKRKRRVQVGEKKYRACSMCKKTHPRHFKPTHHYKTRLPINPLTEAEARIAGKKFMRRLKGRDFKLSCHPSKGISMTGIENQLSIWENVEGFVVDVVIVENVENLAPENSKEEFRHQQNEIWQAGRALSQRRRCLVIFATQADAASYKKKTMGMQNFSEDKRKYGHVTAFLCLNQTKEEKRRGLMRIGQLAVREDDFDSSRPVTVLQCLQIGRPHLGSFL